MKKLILVFMVIILVINFGCEKVPTGNDYKALNSGEMNKTVDSSIKTVSGVAYWYNCCRTVDAEVKVDVADVPVSRRWWYLSAFQTALDDLNDETDALGLSADFIYITGDWSVSADYRIEVNMNEQSVATGGGVVPGHPAGLGVRNVTMGIEYDGNIWTSMDDVYKLTLHEFCHCIGLADWSDRNLNDPKPKVEPSSATSEDTSSIMCWPNNDSLSQGDKDAIKELSK